MKARFFILASALFLLALGLHGQQGNTVYVSQFRGVTVGEKVAVAQAACNPVLACVVVIDPPLAGFATGTLPALGRNVVLQDMRAGSASPSDWHDLTASCRAYRGEVNVLDCGAVADGAWHSGGCGKIAPVGCYYGTDNTAAFRKAVAALPASGGTVRVPVSGTNIYMLGAPQPLAGADDCVLDPTTGFYGVLNLPNFVTIQGAGRWVTTLMANPGTAIHRTCALVQNTGSPTVTGVALKSLRLDGNTNTDSTHHEDLHPENDFGTSTNYLLALILATGTQVQGPSFLMEDFIISGFADSGADGPQQYAFVYIAGQGWVEFRNGRIVDNWWGTFVLKTPDNMFENVYWMNNGGWNNFETLKAYDGGTVFLGNYFGGGGGGTAQVLGIGMQGSRFDSCTFDHTGQAQVRLIDDGSWYAAYNSFVNSIFSQPGAFGTSSPFVSIEGHTTDTTIIGAFFSTGAAGHSTYAVQELGSANQTVVIGASIDSTSPPGTGNWNLIGSRSRVIGAVNAIDTAYTSLAYKGPNATQSLADDSAGGGWNMMVSTGASYGFRFWSGNAATKLGQIDMNGNWWISGGTQVVYRCATAGTLPIGALTITAGSCGTTTDTGLRTK